MTHESEPVFEPMDRVIAKSGQFVGKSGTVVFCGDENAYAVEIDGVTGEWAFNGDSLIRASDTPKGA